MLVPRCVVQGMVQEKRPTKTYQWKMETLLNNNTRIRKKENKARRQVIEEGVVQVEALTGQRGGANGCLLYTSPSPRDLSTSRMPSSA